MDNWIDIDKNLRSLWKVAADTTEFLNLSASKYDWGVQQNITNTRHIFVENNVMPPFIEPHSGKR